MYRKTRNVGGIYCTDPRVNDCKFIKGIFLLSRAYAQKLYCRGGQNKNGLKIQAVFSSMLPVSEEQALVRLDSMH